ncbi:uncharacterized protein [Dermacentor albipictus]|uniref:uncharacterized protein n=1 Tax=Dermacentor albipictus TaxID=60249 RepID=UPI0038FCAD14
MKKDGASKHHRRHSAGPPTPCPSPITLGAPWRLKPPREPGGPARGGASAVPASPQAQNPGRRTRLSQGPRGVWMTPVDDWNNVGRLALSLLGVMLLFAMVFGIAFMLETRRGRHAEALGMARLHPAKATPLVLATNATGPRTTLPFGHAARPSAPKQRRLRDVLQKPRRTRAATTTSDEDSTASDVTS